MKRILTTILTALTLTMAPATLLAGQAAAVNIFQPCAAKAQSSASNSDVCKDVAGQAKAGTNPVISILKIVIQLLALVIGVTAIIIIVVAGLRMVMSAGDAQAVSNARNGIIYALIGLAVAVFAETFVAFVLNRLQ